MVRISNNKILNEFVEKCSKQLDIGSIIQFGSSTYSKNPVDVDLLFISKGNVFSHKDYLNLFSIINETEKKYSEVVFDIGGGKRKRKATLSISIVPFEKFSLKYNSSPFFLKNLVEDANKKVLFGENLLPDEIFIEKDELIKKIILEINHNLRSYFDEGIAIVYPLFKVLLRSMLIDEGIPRKEELLELFSEKHPKIKLPENAREILKNKLRKKDFEDVLKFSEECLEYLDKLK